MVEILVALGIFSMLALATAWILIISLRSNKVIWEQLQTQADGRRTLGEIVEVVRKAELSSVGGYPVVTTSPYELSVYANIDEDTLRERVRFFIDANANTLRRGIIKPNGSPLQYNQNNEVLTTLASEVVNDDRGVPAFTYFDESYTGSELALTQPVSSTQVHVVKIQLELERDPTASPEPLHVETTVHIRNLKTN